MDHQKTLTALSFMNPWWRVPLDQLGLPSYRRQGFYDARNILTDSSRHEAVQLLGPRQSGKTTVLRQLAADLIATGERLPSEICMINRDHPDVGGQHIDEMLKAWNDFLPHDLAREIVLIDEVQYQKDWQLWTKQQVDFNRGRRIVMTGSASTLSRKGIESGVGRWREIPVSLLSYREFLELRGEPAKELPSLDILDGIDKLDGKAFTSFASEIDRIYPSFFRFLLRGGFPVSALAPTDEAGLQTIANDIVQRMLNIDMTAFFGVRKVVEIERLFSYLKSNTGGQLDVATIGNLLEIKKTTLLRYMDFLEHSFLICPLSVFGYGKEILRSRPKIYTTDSCLADPISRGSMILSDPVVLGRLVETTIYKHLRLLASRRLMTFGFWKGKNDHEVDFVVERGNDVIPIEVKFSEGALQKAHLKGLIEFCNMKNPRHAIVITKRAADIGPIATKDWGLSYDTPVYAIPAPLFCHLFT